MAKSKSKTAELEMAVAMAIMQLSNVTRYEIEVMVRDKVGPIAKAFVAEFGDDALKAINIVGVNVSNAVSGMCPVDRLFDYPRNVIAAFGKYFQGEEVEQQPKPEDIDPPKASDPLVPKDDKQALVAALENEAKENTEATGKIELAVSQLGLPETVVDQLFGLEIGTTKALLEYDATVGLRQTFGDEIREKILKAVAEKTGLEVIL